jgi:hypothetical protein
MIRKFKTYEPLYYGLQKPKGKMTVRKDITYTRTVHLSLERVNQFTSCIWRSFETYILIIV